MGSSKWSTLASTSWVDNTATAVIGTPTVEMWMASWNDRYDDTLAYDANTTGYQVGLTADSLSTSISISNMQAKEGWSNTLYYPHGNTSGNYWNSCYGYWLASPSAYDCEYVRAAGGSYVGDGRYDYISGIRPVVCLKSSISATAGTGDYDFSLVK